MIEERLSWKHLAAALAFVAIGFLACLFNSPFRLSHATETRSLVTRLHAATLERAKADSSLVAYKRRAEAQSARIGLLEAAQSVQRATVGRLAQSNQRLADSLLSLARTAPESAAVTELGRGIAEQGRACEGALNACDSAKVILRQQVASADSVAEAERGRSTVNFGLAREATGSAIRWEGKAQSYRRQRTFFVVLSGVLAVVAAVK